MPKSRSLRASIAIRILNSALLTLHSSRPSLQLQIQPKQRHPRGMVLFVIGNLALPAHLLGVGIARRRAAAGVHDLGAGDVENPAVTLGHRHAEVDVLRVEKEPL